MTIRFPNPLTDTDNTIFFISTSNIIVNTYFLSPNVTEQPVSPHASDSSASLARRSLIVVYFYPRKVYLGGLLLSKQALDYIISLAELGCLANATIQVLCVLGTVLGVTLASLTVSFF